MAKNFSLNFNKETISKYKEEEDSGKIIKVNY